MVIFMCCSFVQVDVSDDVQRQLTDLNEVVQCSADSCVNGCCHCQGNKSYFVRWATGEKTIPIAHI